MKEGHKGGERGGYRDWKWVMGEKKWECYEVRGLGFWGIVTIEVGFGVL